MAFKVNYNITPGPIELRFKGMQAVPASDHSKLRNRDEADQHPIGAITGLEDALNKSQETADEAKKAAEAVSESVEEARKTAETANETAGAAKEAAESAEEAAKTAKETAEAAMKAVEEAQPSAGTSDHAMLTNRDQPDQHPIEAITGLGDAIDDLNETDEILTKTTETLAETTEVLKKSIEEVEPDALSNTEIDALWKSIM